MIKMTGETVERTVKGIIDRYSEAINVRGDSKSITHAMDLWALYDALLCVREVHAIHEFEFNRTGVKDQLEDMLRRRRISVSDKLFYAMYEAYMLGAESYSKQLTMAMDEVANKSSTESEVK